VLKEKSVEQVQRGQKRGAAAADEMECEAWKTDHGDAAMTAAQDRVVLQRRPVWP